MKSHSNSRVAAAANSLLENMGVASGECIYTVVDRQIIFLFQLSLSILISKNKTHEKITEIY